MPAVSLLKSIEQLSRNGLVQLKDSIPPNNASSDVIQHVAVEANIGETEGPLYMVFLYAGCLLGRWANRGINE